MLAALKAMGSSTVYRSRVAFDEALDVACQAAGHRLTAAARKLIHAPLSEHDEEAGVCLGADGKPEPDPELRGTENVPLKEDVQEYFEREVLPHVPDAWIDESKTKVGYEIPFARHFYTYTPPRPLEEIEADIKALEDDIVALLKAVTR